MPQDYVFYVLSNTRLYTNDFNHVSNGDGFSNDATMTLLCIPRADNCLVHKIHYLLVVATASTFATITDPTP